MSLVIEYDTIFRLWFVTDGTNQLSEGFTHKYKAEQWIKDHD